MSRTSVQVSSEFKAHTFKAILGILLFVVSYILILICAVLLTGVWMAGGVMIISAWPSFFSIVLGLGLASMGVLIMIFLIKFIFNSHKDDYSHLIEITPSDEPRFFAMLKEIVDEVGTKFPRRVFLAPDVNAWVSYNSNFWSMFLPVRKNLVVGMGLINTCTDDELRAILAHEFGHFSQETMRVGSYVYNLNKVIYNLIFDNQGYERIMQTWGNLSWYFSFFVMVVSYFIQGIQWLLLKLYGVMNLTYMGLSREMEFHADEIAATVTGFEPLKNSLLRISLADAALGSVINFHSHRSLAEGRSQDLYKQQAEVMLFLAAEKKLPIVNQLPVVSIDDVNKFNKSKLVIKDQWASHPTIEDRITRLEATGVPVIKKSGQPARLLLNKFDHFAEEFTNRQLAVNSGSPDQELYSLEKFMEDFKQEFHANQFGELYQGYYDTHNPVEFDLSGSGLDLSPKQLTELVSTEMVDLAYSASALESDLTTIKSVANKELDVKSFDYDGVRYTRRQGANLVVDLQAELNLAEARLAQNDKDLYKYFKTLAGSTHQGQLDDLYNTYFEVQRQFETKFKLYTTAVEKLSFIQEATPVETIALNFRILWSTEKEIKEEITALLADPILQPELKDEFRKPLDTYLSQWWSYFDGERYLNENLQILYAGLNHYVYLLGRRLFLYKKRLLDFQQSLSEASAKP